MLNPWLYRRLEELFGDVSITGEGVELAESSELSLDAPPVGLFNQARPQTGVRVHKVVTRRGEYYNVSCAFCGDDRNRLAISYLWTERPDLCWCYNETNCMQHDSYRTQLRLMILGTRGRLIKPIYAGQISDYVGPNPEVPPPGEVIPLPDLPPGHPVLAYVERRGYDPTYLWQMYDVGCVERVDNPDWRSLEGRLYIPIWMDGKLVSWQGRWPEDLPKEEFKQRRIKKYWNMPGSPAGRILYNFDNADYCQDIVLVEGVIDVWGVGIQGMAVTKCSLSPAQRARLLGRRDRGAIAVVMDGEAYGEAVEIAKDLSAIVGNRAFPVRLPTGRDPGELDPNWTWSKILDEAKERGIHFERIE